jgi:excinuclease ABC subunit C
MFVLQYLRDEAHRFAISFHRRRRGSLTLRSALADVPGIGPQRQRLLLRHFGSLKKIRDATVEELQAVPGMTAKAAVAVVAHLGSAGVAAPATAPASDPLAPAEVAGETFAPGAEPSLPQDAEQDALESAFAEMEDDLDPEADVLPRPDSSS